MKIYLDTNVYNRPFDDQTQTRIESETLIFRVVMRLVEMGDTELVSSYILEYENSRNRFVDRRKWVESKLQLATFYQEMNAEIAERGRALQEQGLGAIDALHVASAEAAGTDYFLTCDDRLIRRYQGSLNLVTPANFILAITRG